MEEVILPEERCTNVRLVPVIFAITNLASVWNAISVLPLMNRDKRWTYTKLVVVPFLARQHIPTSVRNYHVDIHQQLRLKWFLLAIAEPRGRSSQRTLKI